MRPTATRSEQTKHHAQLFTAQPPQRMGPLARVQAFHDNNEHKQPPKQVVMQGLRLTSWDDFLEEVERVRIAAAGDADLRRSGVGGATLRETMYRCIDDRYKVGIPELFVQRCVYTNVKKRNARKATAMRAADSSLQPPATLPIRSVPSTPQPQDRSVAPETPGRSAGACAYFHIRADSVTVSVLNHIELTRNRVVS
ncbi:hypothetical protein NX059_012234 [Plenodomus lindquistii]|nr:hypothetical protein NX059_012234 [Plenodomus lindquistii]